MGRLRRRVRQVWPNLRVELRPYLHLVGVPQDGKISRKYVIDKWQRLWKTRQEWVLRARPSDSQQDFATVGYSTARRIRTLAHRSDFSNPQQDKSQPYADVDTVPRWDGGFRSVELARVTVV